jgi:hypothetical protein
MQLHVQPLPDSRFRFKIEDEYGKIICEVSGSSQNGHAHSESETVALNRARDLTYAMRRALVDKLYGR